MNQEGLDRAVRQYTLQALAVGVKLLPGDFNLIDGEITIDGMPAAEWIYAMSAEG